jgi:hypothetical protein
MGKGKARQAVCSLTQALPVEVCPRSAAVFYSLFLHAGGLAQSPFAARRSEVAERQIVVASFTRIAE